MNSEFSPLNVPWLAGLLEGEGCFYWHKDGRKNRSHFGWPAISLSMTDKDIVERAGKLMGIKAIQFYNQHHLGTKPLYKVNVAGQHAEKLMKILLPYMGERRSTKITELLNTYETRSKRRKAKQTCEILSSLQAQLSS